MTAPWPARLPAPLRAELSRTFVDVRTRKQTDSGPPGYKARYSMMPMSYRMSIAVDQDGVKIFDHFYITTLANGSLPFTMDRPEMIGALLLDDDGDPILGPGGDPILLDITSTFIMGDGVPVTIPWGTVTKNGRIVNAFKISFEAVLLP